VTLLGWGLALTAVLAGLGWRVWGAGALLPTVSFGLLATAIQVGAVALLRSAWDAPFRLWMKRWAVGIALRFAGVVAFAVAVAADRALFPPLPAALGYLGVIVPLLFLEPRFLRRQGH
jgi:hypothetical protein